MPTISTRPLANTRATVNVRSSVSLPGINSARNVRRMPAVARPSLLAPCFRLARLRRSLALSTCVNQTAQAIREEYVNLLRFDHSRHLPLSERRMQH